MDTVIGNKYLEVFNGLNVEVSKKLEGEYTVDEIISTFSNFFFNRMFLDITSIKDYKDMSNLKKLSMNIDMGKVILLLDKDDAISSSNVFLANLVNMGIYSFTTDSNALMYLYNNPNSYRDVAHYQDAANASTKEEKSETPAQAASTNGKKAKVIGIKNVTNSAGATTFAYAMKKVLEKYYHTLLVEVDKMDLVFFEDKGTVSVREDELANLFDKYTGVDVFVVDLNRSSREDLCTDVLYLVEPTTIKLNKLASINPGIFAKLTGEKIVLNKLLLDEMDILSFEGKANLRIFYNIGSFNDKKDVSEIFLPLLQKMGYVANEDVVEESQQRKSVFGFFRR